MVSGGPTRRGWPAETRVCRGIGLAGSGLAWVIATIRSDFFHRCGEVPGFSGLKDALGSYELLPPSGPEIAQIIREHEGTIFDIPTSGPTRLALDANRPDFDPSGPPRFFLWTEDISATVRHLQALEVKITSGVEDIGSVAFVQFEDLDGNPLMVCQPV